VTSAWGYVETPDGVLLGSGQVLGVPMLLPNHAVIQVQADLVSSFTYSELQNMGLSVVHVYVSVDYCAPWSWGWFSGCYRPSWLYPDPYIINQDFTIQELLAWATAYG
jgi:hypothetical protein